MFSHPAPPKITAVYGFLGSGKTTVMLALAEEAVARGRRAAIVVNEAGQVPIDGRMLRVGGLPVKEIFSGCICCSVVGDLIETLRVLSLEPELKQIFIEPSGMADAPNLFATLNKHVHSELTRLLVLDAARLHILIQAAKTLISGQLSQADLILLNKIDAVNKAKRPEVDRLLTDQRPTADIFPVSAREGLPPDVVARLI
jgi:G3E family GTPase